MYVVEASCPPPSNALSQQLMLRLACMVPKAEGCGMQDEAAVATPLGLYLNCASAGLYMANYQLVIPTVSRFLQHMGVDQSAAGLVIGCCDIASIPGTVGRYCFLLKNLRLCQQAGHAHPCVPSSALSVTVFPCLGFMPIV